LPGLTAGRGDNTLEKGMKGWADVDAAFDYWSQKLRYRRFKGENLVVPLPSDWRQAQLLAGFYRQPS
jgi:hypothetical protein